MIAGRQDEVTRDARARLAPRVAIDEDARPRLGNEEAQRPRPMLSWHHGLRDRRGRGGGQRLERRADRIDEPGARRQVEDRRSIADAKDLHGVEPRADAELLTVLPDAAELHAVDHDGRVLRPDVELDERL